MSDDRADRTQRWRRLAGGLLVVAGVAVVYRAACYTPTLLESCTACLRSAPGRCATSTTDTQIARRPGFNAREDAQMQLSCGAIRDQTCTLHPMEDLVFTCQQKVVALPPDWAAPFARLSPR